MVNEVGCLVVFKDEIMRAVFLILFGLLLTSCVRDRVITGYCVGKKLTKPHWSDKPEMSIRYSSVVVPVHVAPRRSTPTWVKTKYQVAISDFENHQIIEIDSVRFFKIKVGSKYSLKYN